MAAKLLGAIKSNMGVGPGIDSTATISATKATRSSTPDSANFNNFSSSRPPSNSTGMSRSDLGRIPEVWSIFPPEQGSIDLTEFPPVLSAQQDLKSVPFGGKEEEINVVIDEEVEDQVVELLGQSSNLGFAIGEMEYPFVVFQMKNMQKYFRFEIGVVDTKGELYTISAKNNQSLVRVKSNTCSLPLKLENGWNRFCLDLNSICDGAFGVKYKCSTFIRVYANCRLWRLFYQNEDYSDDELPLYLRVIEDS